MCYFKKTRHRFVFFLKARLDVTDGEPFFFLLAPTRATAAAPTPGCAGSAPPARSGSRRRAGAVGSRSEHPNLFPGRHCINRSDRREGGRRGCGNGNGLPGYRLGLLSCVFAKAAKRMLLGFFLAVTSGVKEGNGTLRFRVRPRRKHESTPTRPQERILCCRKIRPYTPRVVQLLASSSARYRTEYLCHVVLSLLDTRLYAREHAQAHARMHVHKH